MCLSPLGTNSQCLTTARRHLDKSKLKSWLLVMTSWLSMSHVYLQSFPRYKKTVSIITRETSWKDSSLTTSGTCQIPTVRRPIQALIICTDGWLIDSVRWLIAGVAWSSIPLRKTENLISLTTRTRRQFGVKTKLSNDSQPCNWKSCWTIQLRMSLKRSLPV